jgi:hypothetical protein
MVFANDKTASNTTKVIMVLMDVGKYETRMETPIANMSIITNREPANVSRAKTFHLCPLVRLRLLPKLSLTPSPSTMQDGMATLHMQVNIMHGITRSRAEKAVPMLMTIVIRIRRPVHDAAREAALPIVTRLPMKDSKVAWAIAPWANMPSNENGMLRTLDMMVSARLGMYDIRNDAASKVNGIAESPKKSNGFLKIVEKVLPMTPPTENWTSGAL